MSKNILMILAVIVTVLTGWLVVQVASMDSAGSARNQENAVTTPAAPRENGGQTVKVKTSVTVPNDDVGSSVNVQ